MNISSLMASEEGPATESEEGGDEDYEDSGGEGGEEIPPPAVSKRTGKKHLRYSEKLATVLMGTIRQHPAEYSCLLSDRRLSGKKKVADALANVLNASPAFKTYCPPKVQITGRNICAWIKTGRSKATSAQKEQKDESSRGGSLRTGVHSFAPRLSEHGTSWSQLFEDGLRWETNAAEKQAEFKRGPDPELFNKFGPDATARDRSKSLTAVNKDGTSEALALAMDNVENMRDKTSPVSLRIGTPEKKGKVKVSPKKSPSHSVRRRTVPSEKESEIGAQLHAFLLNERNSTIEHFSLQRQKMQLAQSKENSKALKACFSRILLLQKQIGKAGNSAEEEMLKRMLKAEQNNHLRLSACTTDDTADDMNLPSPMRTPDRSATLRAEKRSERSFSPGSVGKAGRSPSCPSAKRARVLELD